MRFPALNALRRGREALTIFCFHAVVGEPLAVRNFCFTPLDIFRGQLEAIAARYAVLPLALALEGLWAGTLKGPSAVLTFDDGFRNNRTIALPVLRKMGLPAALFLCTGPVIEKKLLWFARLHRAVCLSARTSIEWQSERYDLRDASERAKASARWQTELKRLPPAEVDAACDELCGLMEVGQPGFEDPDFGMSDEVMLKEMVHAGLFTIGAHTRSHAILSRLARNEQHAEVAQSIADAEMLTGSKPKFFAYPNGHREDFNEESFAVLRGLEFQAAFTSVERSYSPGDQRLQMPRVLLGDRSEVPFP